MNNIGITDPKLLKKAAPRGPDRVSYSEEPVVFVPDFEGTITPTGKKSTVTGSSKLEYYTERLDPSATTETYTHGTKSKVVIVLFGELQVLEFGQDKIVLRVGHSYELNAGTTHTFRTGTSACVFSVVQEAKYDARLVIDLASQQAGLSDQVLTVFTPAPRYRSRAKEQLAALNPEPERFVASITDEGINNMPQTNFDD